jgi:formylglycine-generating enzyme
MPCLYFGIEAPLFANLSKESKKVHRGGSFLCTDQCCSRSIADTKGKGEVSTGTTMSDFAA